MIRGIYESYNLVRLSLLNQDILGLSENPKDPESIKLCKHYNITTRKDQDRFDACQDAILAELDISKSSEAVGAMERNSRCGVRIPGLRLSVSKRPIGSSATEAISRHDDLCSPESHYSSGLQFNKKDAPIVTRPAATSCTTLGASRIWIDMFNVRAGAAASDCRPIT
ncbi:hypothetical protein CSOJ01_09917 [Colletotrichum sojae]|uniref:Uncharacterized protein n=1 Tax=Colletotrichum sojae TaxID=2175907 RepID=A0A8H6J1Y0_9PEZI|nr:hypothetical protein CSOJ01_09917 [Colletotrichum sojae]